MGGERLQLKSNPAPEVSIITVVNTNSPYEAVFNLLDSFYPQEGDISFEFIVVEGENEKKAEIYSKNYPWVKLVSVEKVTRGSHLRNIALKHVHGKFIVFMEDHITVQKDYLINLLKCFSKGYDIVGGPVENGFQDSLNSWAHYFSEYHKWIPIVREGEIGDLPGCNFAYRSDLFRRLGLFTEGNFKLESLFHERAKKIGKRLYFSHGLKIKHFDNKNTVDLWMYRFQYGRLFASKRGFPLWKRTSYAMLSPLIALNEYVRIFNRVKNDRFYLKKFIQCTPVLISTLLIWMAGEFTGYVFNDKRSTVVSERPQC